MPNNVTEHIIRLKDQFTGPLAGIATNTNRVLGDISRRTSMIPKNIVEMQARINQLQKTVSLSVDTRQIRAANREIQHLEGRINRLNGLGVNRGGKGGGGLSLGGMAKGFLGYQALSMVGGGVSSAFQNAMQMQSSQVGLKTFLGDKGAASAFANIQKDAAKTPYDTESLLQVNRALISAGLNAKDARRDTMNLANAVSAVGGGNAELSRMAANMQQIKTVGKATAMDIKQFGMAGINIYQMLANVTGKSIDKVKEMDVSYNVLSAALGRAAEKGGMYYGALEAQSQTMGGKLSTLTDNIKTAMGKAVLAFEPLINKGIDFAIGLTNNIGPAIQGVMNFIKPLAQELISGWKAIYGATQPLIGALKTNVMPLLTKLRDTLVGAFKAAMPWITNLWAMLSNVLGPAIRLVTPIFSKLLSVVGWIIEKVSLLLEKVTWLFSKIAQGVGWMLDKIAETVTPKINHIKEAIKAGVSDERMTEFFKKIGDIHGSAYMNAISAKMTAVAKFMDSYYRTGNHFQSKLQELKARANVKKELVVTPGGNKGLGSNYNLSGEDLKGKTKKDVDSITGGGAKNIYITLGKFQDQLNIHTMTVKEGVNEMEEMITNSLLRVLNSANALQR